MNRNVLNDFGVYGLGVMGASLALNLARHGLRVSAFNLTYDLTERLLQRPDANGLRLYGARTVFEFVTSLMRPRRILIMVTAGAAVDSVIEQLRPFLEPGDILIDGGNTHFPDTERRQAALKGTGIELVGMGVSGGEQGALWGPSLMPGGDAGTYHYLADDLKQIAAKADDGAPCVTYIGRGGAGHFVKMVHNGIEYGDMQLIAEAYDLLRNGLGLDPDTLAATFAEWNRGELNSYLVDITSHIVRRRDDLGDGLLIDKIVDRAGMKGTATWTGTAALDLGEAIPTIIEALHARALSAVEEDRALARKAFGSDTGAFDGGDRGAWIAKIRDAMYASKICSYSQGFALLQRASATHNYGLRLADIARIWRGGCIIRASFLDRVSQAFAKEPDLPNLLASDSFADDLRPRIAAWRETVALGAKLGIPLPAMSASLSYFETLRRDRLPASLLQAQRDCFGAHTYKRIDRPGSFHTQWM